MRVWESSAQRIVACAGTQGGKTAIEAPWLLRELARCAPLIYEQGFGRAIYGGPTMTLMGKQAIPDFKRHFLRFGEFVGSPSPVFKFHRQGLLEVFGFTHAEVTVNFAYMNDSSNLESLTACCAVVDEVGQKEAKRESNEALSRRLLKARTAGYGRCLYGTTPYTWDWFKDDLVDKNGQHGIEVINWPSWMNPTVSEEVCRAELAAGMPLWKWEMMYLGMFTRPAGLIYDCFDPIRNVCERFPIPPDWKVYPGGDFGNNNTAFVLVAESPSGVLYPCFEYLSPEARTVDENTAAVKASGYSLRPGAAGSHQEEGWREAYRKSGLMLDEPPYSGPGSVEVQIQCVYEALKTENLIIPRDMVGLLGEISSYSRELDDHNNPTERIANKATYHRLDALRSIVTKLRPPKASAWGTSEVGMALALGLGPKQG